MIRAMADPVNPTRPCFGCQTFDDHPRHEIVDSESGADAHDGPMHMDCCAALRNCELCREVLARAYALAGGGAIGEDLREALVQLPALQVDHTESHPFIASVTEIAPEDLEVLRG